MATETIVAPAAPVVTPTTPVETVTATVDAASKGDFSGFQDAATATRTGKPLPDVARPADVPPPTLSRRERQEQRQQAENDRIRAAIEEGVQLELTKRGAAPAVDTPSVPVARVAAVAPGPQAPPKTFEEAIQRPDVSKPLLSEPAFFEAYPDAPYSAYARYASHYDFQARSQTSQRDAERTAVREAQASQVNTFLEGLREAAAADPQFVPSLTPDVRERLKPFSALQRDATGTQIEQGGPINVIGEQVWALPKELVKPALTYFSQHPEALTRLETVPPHLQNLPPALRTARHISWMLREFGKIEATLDSAAPPVAPTAPTTPRVSTLSRLPPPPPTVDRSTSTADPVTSALKRNDFEAAKAAWTTERAAKRNGAA